MKALIAMSGGVDSSVAALIMKNRGYDCIGCTMKLFGNADEGTESTCCSEKDVDDARNVAMRLGMEYYVFNFKDDFKEKVINKFVNCYLCGMTPNPCIECNDKMKFDKLHRRAMELGYEYVVTGHYARVEEKNGKFVLREAVDPLKDQSYVLYRMTQEQLAHTIFPLGEMSKDETRKLAEDNEFINANKKDSQDICFVPDGDYAKVIEANIGHSCAPGDFVDVDGKVLGKHKGIIHYTIGQRKGLGIAAAAPLYVVKIDTENNRVILGSNDDLFSTHLHANEVNWISGEVPSEPFKAEIRVRYHGKKVPGTVTPVGENEFDVEFEEPVRAITPGQSAVIYNGDTVIGGGEIGTGGRFHVQ